MEDRHLLECLLGAILLSENGDILLEKVPSLLRERFNYELSSNLNTNDLGHLEEYVEREFPRLCKVYSTDGCKRVQIRELDEILHLLPSDYREVVVPEKKVEVLDPIPRQDEPQVNRPPEKWSSVVKRQGPPIQERRSYNRDFPGTSLSETKGDRTNGPSGNKYITQSENSPAGFRPRFQQSSQNAHLQVKSADRADDQERVDEGVRLIAEKCRENAISEPEFVVKSTRSVMGLTPEYFCIAHWGSERIRSHPQVFLTEAGARACVFQKIFNDMDNLVKKVKSEASQFEKESKDEMVRKADSGNCHPNMNTQQRLSAKGKTLDSVGKTGHTPNRTGKENFVNGLGESSPKTCGEPPVDEWDSPTPDDFYRSSVSSDRTVPSRCTPSFSEIVSSDNQSMAPRLTEKNTPGFRPSVRTNRGEQNC